MDEQAAATALRAQGAVFAYVHGSVARGTQREGSDLDVAAFFREPARASFDLRVPSGVDVLVLNDAPLEIAGRIALDGRLLFETDEVARVRWEATTRKIYLDERYRIERAHREFLEAVRRG